MSKLSFPCVLLVESVSREIDEIKLSPSHQRERETMHYSPVNNEKKSCAPSREHASWKEVENFTSKTTPKRSPKHKHKNKSMNKVCKLAATKHRHKTMPTQKIFQAKNFPLFF